MITKNFLGLIYGIVYGVAHVVPGLSGGTFLVIFGCYDTICEAFALNFKVIKKNFFFLLFFGIGTVGGLVGFVHAISYLFNNFGIQTNLFFMGLILGGIPLIAKIATEEKKFNSACILPFILGLALVLAIFFMEKFGAFGAGAALQDNSLSFTVKIVLYSFVAAMAMVMPGISGAFILVAFGVYNMYMEALKALDMAILVPAVVGILFGIVAGAKLILWLMKKHKLIVYSTIMGMVAGSIAPVFPAGLGLNAATLTGIVCFLFGGWVALILGKREATQI